MNLQSLYEIWDGWLEFLGTRISKAPMHPHGTAPKLRRRYVCAETFRGERFPRRDENNDECDFYACFINILLHTCGRVPTCLVSSVLPSCAWSISNPIPNLVFFFIHQMYNCYIWHGAIRVKKLKCQISTNHLSFLRKNIKSQNAPHCFWMFEKHKLNIYKLQNNTCYQKISAQNYDIIWFRIELYVIGLLWKNFGVTTNFWCRYILYI